MPIVPGSLVAVLLGIAVVELFDLDVDIVGHIDGGLPSFGAARRATTARSPRAAWR